MGGDHEWDQCSHRRDCRELPHAFHQVKTQDDNGCPRARKRPSPDTESADAWILGFSLQTARTKCVLFRSHPVCGIL